MRPLLFVALKVLVNDCHSQQNSCIAFDIRRERQGGRQHSSDIGAYMSHMVGQTQTRASHSAATGLRTGQDRQDMSPCLIGRAMHRTVLTHTAAGAPVPEPMAPMKSAMMVRAPMHMPPKAAAVGM